MRQVVTGRVKETPQDIRDITLAMLNGDFNGLKDTLSQRGKNVSPDVSATVAGGTSGETARAGLQTAPITGDLLAKAVELGQAAKGYRLGATGPDYYDCSGLVWRAMRDLKIYNGPRFTTKSFVAQMGNTVSKVSNPIIGDIVLWPGKHMGIVAGNGKMYSAMSPANGIGYGSIDGSNASIGGTPVYYRLSSIKSAMGNTSDLSSLLNPSGG
jgi:cell wall-associated NlpC family hydrolase